MDGREWAMPTKRYVLRGTPAVHASIRPTSQPVAIDVVFNPTVRLDSEDTVDSQTSSPLYFQPFQALEILWDQGVKGSLSIQEDDNIAQDQPYIVFQTGDGGETGTSPAIEAFVTSERLSVRFKSLGEKDASEKTYNAILRVSSSAEVIAPIRIRGAEATLELSEVPKQMKFSRLEVDSLLSGFDFENLQVGSLRVSSGTGDISGTFNVTHELDLKTTTQVCIASLLSEITNTFCVGETSLPGSTYTLPNSPIILPDTGMESTTSTNTTRTTSTMNTDTRTTSTSTSTASTKTESSTWRKAISTRRRPLHAQKSDGSGRQKSTTLRKDPTSLS